MKKGRKRTPDERLEYIAECCDSVLRTFGPKAPVTLNSLRTWIRRSEYGIEREDFWPADYKHPPDKMIPATKLAMFILANFEADIVSVREIAWAHEILRKEVACTSKPEEPSGEFPSQVGGPSDEEDIDRDNPDAGSSERSDRL